MNMHVGARQFEPPSAPAKPGLSPKGDQGGWEGGARGL
jgi:hypothetical protein